jgi:hypothetical protein
MNQKANSVNLNQMAQMWLICAQGYKTEIGNQSEIWANSVGLDQLSMGKQCRSRSAVRGQKV